MRSTNSTGARNPLIWPTGLLALYLAIPLTLFVLRVTGPGQHGFRTPGLYPALETSILTASITTGIVAVCGIPLAHLLAISRGRLSTLVGYVVHLPLALPPLMSGILLIYVVGPYTAAGRLFGGRLTDSIAGIVMAQMFVSAPFLIITARSAFRTVDPALVDLATTLGHGPLSRFRRVYLPIAAPGIRAGMTLTWLRAFGEYGATVILAYHPFTLPVYSYTQFSGFGLSTTEAPTALALVTAVVILLIGNVRFRRRVRPSELPLTSRTPRIVPQLPVGFDLDYSLGSFRLAAKHLSGGRRLAIIGPSGSGKSTMLRCLAGLCGPGPGRIWFGDRVVDDVPAEHRRVGYVTQGLALFPHLTVWEHLLFAPEADPRLAAYWLSRFDLTDVREHLSHQLSGGQRQRVKLAQVLSRSPDLLLLDEPFSALDAAVRSDFLHELRRLQREVGVTTVLVTHDPTEAAMLADDIIVLADGEVLQSGTRDDVFARPVTPTVARLLGTHNVRSATVVCAGNIAVGQTVIQADTGGITSGAPVWWRIEPEHVQITPNGALSGTVIDLCHLGTAIEIDLAVGPHLTLRSRMPTCDDVAVGDWCHFELPAKAITLWPQPAGTDLTPTRSQRETSRSVRTFSPDSVLTPLPVQDLFLTTP